MRWLKTFAEVRALAGEITEDELLDKLLTGEARAGRRNHDRTVTCLTPPDVAMIVSDGEIDLANMRIGERGIRIFILGDGRPLPPPPPLNYFDLVIEGDSFPPQPLALSAREVYFRKKEPSGLEAWYIARTRQVAHSTRGEDLAAAREHFWPWTKDRDVVRALRKAHAPEHWKKRGPKIRPK
jgi:hypothetical protein